jgi:beta-phosphoglucomutase-like phosphatase (HAD superfamily)
MRHEQFINKFDHVVLASDDPEVQHGKPHPQCFQASRAV